MARRLALATRLGLSTIGAEKQAVCGACGNIMVPGCSGKLKFEADKAFKRKIRKRNQNPRGKKPLVERAGPSKVITCGRCDRVTKIQLSAPPAIERQKIELPQASSIKRSPEPTPKNTSNAASKRRAKARKAGLQGLLASSKAAASNSRPALTLSSFMKK
jgi:hypothetical protein